MLGVILVSIAIALGVGAFGYFIGWKFSKKPILENNKQILQERQDVKEQIDNLKTDLNDLVNTQTSLQVQVKSLEKNKTNLNDDCCILNSRLQEQQNLLDRQKNDLEQRKQQVANDYQVFLDGINEQKITEEEELLSLSQQHQAVLDNIKRQFEIDSKLDFYKLQLNDEEIEDIKYLNSIRKSLNYPTAIGKIIWTMFVQKKTKALAERVLGKNTVCGIYRLCNVKNNFCYIGQAVDCKKRLTDHMKAGCGAVEVSNKNKLYAAMMKDGLENFTYELLEECRREDLNKKEKYYIEFYQSTIVGYNTTAGNGE